MEEPRFSIILTVRAGIRGQLLVGSVSASIVSIVCDRARHPQIGPRTSTGTISPTPIDAGVFDGSFQSALEQVQSADCDERTTRPQ